MANTIRDDRTIAVENASYKLGYIILMFGVLLDGSVRGFVRQGYPPDPWSIFDSNWDLLALVVVSSGAATIYQAMHGTLQHGVGRFALTMVAAAILAIALGWLLR